MVVGARDKDKYNWQDVYANPTNEIYGCKKGILQIEGGRREGKTILEVMMVQKEMLKTKTKLDDLLERYKDLDPMFVNNRLEEYNNLVHYYSIFCTKQQMEGFQRRTKWMVRNGEGTIQRKNAKEFGYT